MQNKAESLRELVLIFKKIKKMVHNNKVYLLKIDGNSFEWHQSEITGAEIRQLGNIHEDYEILLKIQGHQDDRLIGNDDSVDLSLPGIEKFYSKEPVNNFRIIVNGREKSWGNKTITYDEVVKLAFENYVESPDIVYTVDYVGGPHQNPAGSMVKGSSVYVKNKMIFNVTATNRS